MTNNRHQHPPQPVTTLIMSSIFQFQSQAQRPGQTLPDKVGRGYIYIATHRPGWHRGSQQIQVKDQICLFPFRARKQTNGPGAFPDSGSVHFISLVSYRLFDPWTSPSTPNRFKPVEGKLESKSQHYTTGWPKLNKNLDLNMGTLS